MRQILLIVAVLVALSGFAFSQTSGVPPHHSQAATVRSADPQFGQHRNENIETERRMEREREKRVNKERQEKLKRDTDKLLALATELKQYVDKTNENVLSVDVIRKAAEIEKLAHDVKEKMKE